MATDRPCLILVPGLLCDAIAWENQVLALRDAVEPTVADLRGHRDLGGMADAILDRAPDRFALAGHSLGGRVALEIIDRAPERVDRLALLDTGTHPVADGEPARRAASEARAATEGIAAFADTWIPQIVPPYRLADTELIARLRDMICGFTVEDYRAQNAAMLARRDAAPILPQIACPTLVLCGADDLYSPPDQHRDMANRIPRAELAVLDRCGHMAPMEAPAAVADRLRAWLGDRGAPQRR